MYASNTHTDKICLRRPISLAPTWPERLCACSCMADWVQRIFAQFTVCKLCQDVFVFVCKVTLADPAVRWDTARWCLAVGCLRGDRADDVVYEVYWSDMHSSQSPLAPSHCLSSCFSHSSQFMSMCQPLTLLGVASARTQSRSFFVSYAQPIPTHTSCLSVNIPKLPQPSNWPAKNLQAVTSHILCSNLIEPSLPLHSISMRPLPSLWFATQLPAFRKCFPSCHPAIFKWPLNARRAALVFLSAVQRQWKALWHQTGTFGATDTDMYFSCDLQPRLKRASCRF